MSAVPHIRLTEDEYLEIERAAEFRNEYYDGFMYAMSGGTMAHAFIIGNLTSALHHRLRDKPCGVAPNDFRVRVSGRFYTYPDIVVACDPIELKGKDTLLNPTLLVEVVSPSSESRDRTFKFDQYRGIDSLREYAIVSQFEPRVDVFRRDASGQWLFFAFTGLDATCAMESVGASIALAEIYHRIEFAAAEPSQTPQSE
jgi:Uma2 family endonuclease